MDYRSQSQKESKSEFQKKVYGYFNETHLGNIFSTEWIETPELIKPDIIKIYHDIGTGFWGLDTNQLLTHPLKVEIDKSSYYDACSKFSDSPSYYPIDHKIVVPFDWYFILTGINTTTRYHQKKMSDEKKERILKSMMSGYFEEGSHAVRGIHRKDDHTFVQEFFGRLGYNYGLESFGLPPESMTVEGSLNDLDQRIERIAELLLKTEHQSRLEELKTAMIIGYEDSAVRAHAKHITYAHADRYYPEFSNMDLNEKKGIVGLNQMDIIDMFIPDIGEIVTKYKPLIC